MKIDIDIKDYSGDVLETLPQQLKNALWAIGATAEGHAKEKCPVDTGRLRNSISHAETEDSAYIGTNVEYAPYVELGSRGRSGAHFLKDAAADHAEEYKAIIEAALKS